MLETWHTEVTKKRPVVLVADDDPVVRERLEEQLQGLDVEVRMATNGREVLARVSEGGIDLVLLDMIMPAMDGLECCRILRARGAEDYVPVMLVTVRGDTGSRIAGLRMGADGYLVKPVEERELRYRASALLRRKAMHDEFVESKRRLEELVVRDELTSLHNYRYLQMHIDDEVRRVARYGFDLGCLIIDIDRFKAINDGYGHDVGDQVLVEVAARLRASAREVDVVTRCGGEEFTILLPHTGRRGAIRAAERFLQAIRQTPVLVGDKSISVTASAGVAGVAGYDAPIEGQQLLRAADRALYRAKAEGRDRAIVGTLDEPDFSAPVSTSSSKAGGALDHP